MGDVRVSDVDRKIEELREATSIANGTLKDLKRAKMEALEAIERLNNKIDEDVQNAVKAGLDRFSTTLMKAIGECEERIFKRFDRLGNILMGEDDSRKESLAQIVREWMHRT